jgi:hypothetical protein
LHVASTNLCEFAHSDQSNAALANLTMSALLVPWTKSTNNVDKETIKWSHGNTKHETCSPVLEDLELKMLMPLPVKTKIEQVMTVDAHLGPSLFGAFPRTMSTALRTAWDVIVADQDPEDVVEGFEVSIHSFIASHSTAEDQHELLSQLQNPHKPREINVLVLVILKLVFQIKNMVLLLDQANHLVQQFWRTRDLAREGSINGVGR